MPGLPKAEMRQAFIWTCESCGRDNFERAILWEAPHDRSEAYAGESGQWLVCPEEVSCSHCRIVHTAVDAADPPD